MAPSASLLVGLMSVACLIGQTDAYLNIGWGKTTKQENCDFQGYPPNGRAITISDVTPIEVEAPASALAQIAGIGAAGKLLSTNLLVKNKSIKRDQISRKRLKFWQLSNWFTC